MVYLFTFSRSHTKRLKNLHFFKEIIVDSTMRCSGMIVLVSNKIILIWDQFASTKYASKKKIA
jgi:hypothetical protein